MRARRECAYVLPPRRLGSIGVLAIDIRGRFEQIFLLSLLSIVARTRLSSMGSICILVGAALFGFRSSATSAVLSPRHVLGTIIAWQLFHGTETMIEMMLFRKKKKTNTKVLTLPLFAPHKKKMLRSAETRAMCSRDLESSATCCRVCNWHTRVS